MSVSSDLLELLPDEQEFTTHSISQSTGIEHLLVRARMGWLHRRAEIEHVRDDVCDPSLGEYIVGVYRLPPA